MSKKAYVATIEIQIAVWAETETEAQELARRGLPDEAMQPGDFQIQPMIFVPNGWEDTGILYSNGEEQVSVKDVLDKLKVHGVGS